MRFDASTPTSVLLAAAFAAAWLVVSFPATVAFLAVPGALNLLAVGLLYYVWWPVTGLPAVVWGAVGLYELARRDPPADPRWVWATAAAVAVGAAGPFGQLALR